MWNSYFLAESWQFTGQEIFFFCLTHAVNWNKNLNFFKLLVAECSSSFNEKVMQEKRDRVVADRGFRPPQTEEGNGPKFSASWVSAWRWGYYGKCGPFSFHCTLSNAVLVESREHLAFWLGHPGHFGKLQCLRTPECGYRTWMGLVKTGTSPGMGNSKTSKSLLGSFCQGNGDTYNFAGTQWDGIIFFRDLSVQLRCLYSVQLLF